MLGVAIKDLKNSSLTQEPTKKLIIELKSAKGAATPKLPCKEWVWETGGGVEAQTAEVLKQLLLLRRGNLVVGIGRGTASEGASLHANTISKEKQEEAWISGFGFGARANRRKQSTGKGEAKEEG